MSSSLPEAGGEGNVAQVWSLIAESPIVSWGRDAAAQAGTVAKKLLWSTGRAAWLAGTTSLVFFVPMMFVLDREQQLNELEMQQASLLGTPSPLPPK